MKNHILFIDDEPMVLDSLRRMLRRVSSDWKMTFCSDPCEAWQRLLDEPVDAVVADIAMPEIDGLELLQRMQRSEKTRDIPVVMLTGLGDRSLKRKALELGATDLLCKPVTADDLVARIASVLRLKAHQDQLKAQTRYLEAKVREQTARLVQTRLEIVWRLAAAAECRDEDTGNHVIRVGCVSRAIAERMSPDPMFIEMVFLAAPLHDIGKIGIPDSILRKPGPLTPEERAIMEQHCRIGAEILRKVPGVRNAFVEWYRDPLLESVAEAGNPVLNTAAAIALMHHERWDGKGYPQQLAGEEISLEARIVALADVFDALLSKRPYKEAFSEKKSLAIVRNERGRHFDPAVCDAFEDALNDVRNIYERFRDSATMPILEEASV